MGAVDLAGNPRFYDEPTVPDTGIPVTSLVIDIGAYEFGSDSLLEGACCVGDGCLPATEDDCIAVGGTYFGDGTDCGSVTCAPACPEDVNGDGMVNLSDLAMLLATFGTSCP